ncbi:hypothetical protein B5X24_HaOG200242 [Helicoverpa armigera]|nr:hypothetical protein B5X24_HaOG200242 [Helicoverpa armigera]
MPKAVFYYFKMKGLGEPCRLLLAYGGVDFEDIRFERHGQEWQDFKPKTPFGQVPILEMDGKTYAQSYSIARFLGRKFGLGGDNIQEEFEIDQIVDLIDDLRKRAASVDYEPEPDLKEKRHAIYAKTVYPDLLQRINDIIVKNNGYVALGKLTWGDFILAGLIDYLKKMLRMPDLEKQYPAFKQVVDKVFAFPKVKAYADTAPEALF